MVWVDFLIIGIILISAVISIVRGFVKEVFSLASWILAFWVALLFYPHLATLLADYVATPSIRSFTAFAALFIVTLILGALVNHLISTIVKKTGLSGTDRMLGIFFGIIRGVAIVTLLVLAAGATPMPQDDWWQNSLLLEHFETLAVWVQAFLPSDIADHIAYP
ncbi:MAG: CvpA family protein [Methylophaga sp.]|nr:CvpA family protein [Methylophaga sp.]